MWRDQSGQKDTAGDDHRRTFRSRLKWAKTVKIFLSLKGILKHDSLPDTRKYVIFLYFINETIFYLLYYK